jgi:hypothetical protein
MHLSYSVQAYCHSKAVPLEKLTVIGPEQRSVGRDGKAYVYLFLFRHHRGAFGTFAKELAICQRLAAEEG